MLGKVGTWRVYFNRHGAAPLLWCVSPIDEAWEICVKHVHIVGTVTTVYRPKDGDESAPTAWIQATGLLVIDDGGRATITS